MLQRKPLVEESSNLDSDNENHDESETDLQDDVAIAKMTAYLNQQHWWVYIFTYYLDWRWL